MWFDILKNEMRTVNLPKFKVKPFDVNKPDEDKEEELICSTCKIFFPVGIIK